MRQENSDVLIRPASPDDAAILAQFAARAFVDAFIADNDPSDIEHYVSQAFTQAQVASEIANPESLFLLATLGGELVGYAKLHNGEALACVSGVRPVELVRLYSRVDHIGRGIGSALMRECLERAKKGGHDTIWLGVWERNKRAIDFYQRRTFTVVGSHEFVMGGDVQTDLIMQRSLTPP